MKDIKVGLIGILNQNMEEDFWGTCKKLAEIGYEGLESTRFLLEGDTAKKVKKIKYLGLQPVTYSTTKKELQNDIDMVIKKAQNLDAAHISIWYGPAESRTQLKRDAEVYNRAGKKIKAEGLKLCYHNHEHELDNFFNGLNALEILAEYTDSENLYFELDCGWLTFSQADPIYVLKKLSDRIPAIHLKDLKGTDYSGRDQVVFSAVGTGIVDIENIVKTAVESGTEWIVVEQDRVRNLSPLETVKASYLNMKEMNIV